MKFMTYIETWKNERMKVMEQSLMLRLRFEFSENFHNELWIK